MRSDPIISKFQEGVVEVDECYLGGKAKNKRGRGAENKSIVFGIRERQGSIKLSILENVKHDSIAKEITKYVDPKIKMLCADEFPSYNKFAKIYNLQRVQHSKKEYVRGMVHTNSVESIWALIKRGVHGTYHHISKKYLPLYLNEFEYRFNSKENGSLFEVILANGLKAKPAQKG